MSVGREIELKSDDICIQNVSKQKFLGVYIDENLNWSAHIDYLRLNVSSKISLLRQLSEYVQIEAQKQFYQRYIMPVMDYGSIVWGSTSLSNLERLLNLQKRAARTILKSDFRTPSADMFKELGWLSVERRLKYNKAVLTYKALNNSSSVITDNDQSQSHARNATVCVF